jgi:hypothetical protein
VYAERRRNLPPVSPGEGPVLHVARRCIARRGDSVVAAATKSGLQERGGGTLATDLFIGGPVGGAWGLVCAGQRARVGPDHDGV